MSRRRFYLGTLLVVLVLAGVASAYASGRPDPLERVAAPTAEEHDLADGPVADYEVRGVGDDRLSVGLSGVIGVALVLGFGAGALALLRRRDSDRLRT